MTTLTIAPTRIELGLGREQYDGLILALQNGGYDALLRPPPEEERRGGPTIDLPMVYDVVIFLGEHVADATIGAIVAITIDRLRRPTKRKRAGAIYGPDGKPIRTFELPADEESA